MTNKILLVEDEAIIALNQVKTIEKHGYEVVSVYNGEHAVEKVHSDPKIALILMDIDLGKGMDGTETAQKILKDHEIPILFLTSHAEKEYVDRVKNITRYGYVLKNSGEFVLIESINMAFELFEAHREVKEREKRYESLFYNSHSPMMLLRPGTGEIIDVNHAACNFYGWSVEQFTSKTVHEINQLTESEVHEEMNRAKQEERDVFYFTHALADGSLREVEVRSSPIYIQGEKLLYSIISDISDKKRAEERFQTIVETHPEPLFIQTDMKFAYLNPAAVTLLGASSQSELLGTPVMEHFHPDFHSTVRERIKRLNVKREPVKEKLDLKFLRIDGSSVWVETTGIPIEYAGKQGALVSVQDITHRKRTEKELTAYKERMEATMQIGNIAWWEMDVTTGKVTFNRQKADMLGYSPEVFSTYHDFTNLLHPDDYEHAMQSMRECLSGKTQAYKVDYRIKTRSGRYTWFHDLGGVVTRNEKGAPIKVPGVVIDIDDRKEAEEQIKESVKEKDFLMRELNHRVKNNLNMVSSLISLKDSETSQDLSDIIHQIDAIGQVHEKLHHTQDVTHINFKEYIEDLLETVFASF
ncbi:MAG: PAS domain S-box protein, partial [Spirochaetaceae bacterium]|nr:PAS domain S-box protein [Spirochaetaceae bacterium]